MGRRRRAAAGVFAWERSGWEDRRVGPAGRRAGLVERGGARRNARAVISALVVVLLASVVFTSLNDSSVKRSLLRHDQALLDLTGLDQRWNLFAPDPRRRSLDVRAVIRYAGGGSNTWRLPHGAPVVG